MQLDQVFIFKITGVVLQQWLPVAAEPPGEPPVYCIENKCFQLKAWNWYQYVGPDTYSKLLGSFCPSTFSKVKGTPLMAILGGSEAET